MHFRHSGLIGTKYVEIIRAVRVYAAIWTIPRNQYTPIEACKWKSESWQRSSQSTTLQWCRPVQLGSHNASIGEAICKTTCNKEWIHPGSALVLQHFQVSRSTCTLGGRLPGSPSTASRAEGDIRREASRPGQVEEPVGGQRPSRTAIHCSRRNSRRPRKRPPTGRSCACFSGSKSSARRIDWPHIQLPATSSRSTILAAWQ